MSTEVPVPILGESISEATVATWFKNLGDMVLLDEPLVELETDKVTLEVNSPISGVLTSILCETGANVEVGALLCVVSETNNSEATILEKTPKQVRPIVAEAKQEEFITPSRSSSSDLKTLSPAVRKLVDDNNLDPTRIKPSGKDGRILKADVLAAIQAKHFLFDGRQKSRHPYFLVLPDTRLLLLEENVIIALEAPHVGKDRVVQASKEKHSSTLFEPAPETAHNKFFQSIK